MSRQRIALIASLGVAVVVAGVVAVLIVGPRLQSGGPATTPPHGGSQPGTATPSVSPPSSGEPVDYASLCHAEIGADSVVTGTAAVSHQSWGEITILSCGPTTQAPSSHAGVLAVDQAGVVRWRDAPTGAVTYAYELAQPATDASGNIFLSYNPGRYDGLVILRPTQVGIEVVVGGYYGSSVETSLDFYPAELVPAGTDGLSQVKVFSKDCDPDCATDTFDMQLYAWDGETYVPLPADENGPIRPGCPEGIEPPAEVSQAVCQGGPPAGAGSLSAADADADGWYSFATPSGNIRCSWWVDDRDGRGLGCSLLEADFAQPPKPADCALGWDGTQVWLSSAVEVGSCSGERLGAWYRDQIPVLEYGESITDGTWACASAREGLTCWNTETRHGFRLARGAQLAW